MASDMLSEIITYFFLLPKLLTILVVGWEKNKSNFLSIANTVCPIQSKGVNLKPQLEIHRD